MAKNFPREALAAKVMLYDTKHKCFYFHKKHKNEQGRLVGGKCDPHESVPVALVREVVEETGMKITAPLAPKLMIQQDDGQTKWTTYVFLVLASGLRSVYKKEYPDSELLEWYPDKDAVGYMTMLTAISCKQVESFMRILYAKQQPGKPDIAN